MNLWWTGHLIPSKEQVWNLAVLLNWQNTEEVTFRTWRTDNGGGQPLTSWMKHIHMGIEAVMGTDDARRDMGLITMTRCGAGSS